MTLRRHFLSAAIQFAVVTFAWFFVVSLAFRRAMFPGKTLLHLLAFTSLAALIPAFVVLLDWLAQHTFEWCLVGNTLIKKRARPPHDEIARIDLRQILHFRVRREVPFRGRVWTLLLTMNEIVEEPPVYFEFLSLKCIGRTGQHRTYDIQFLSREDKDAVLSAIQSAANADSHAGEPA